MIDLKCNNLGFMKDAAYTAHFYLIVKEYEGKFDGAENVTVEIEEIPYSMLSFKRDQWLVISEFRRNVTIKFTAHQYYDNKGKVTSIPSPHSILTDLHNQMKRAVELYNNNVQ